MNKLKRKYKILMIGAGNLGGNLLPVLLKKFASVKVINRNKSVNKELKRIYKLNIETTYNKDDLVTSDVIILCIQDRYIDDVFKKIINSGINLKNKYFIHFSGSLSSEIFNSNKVDKRNVISAHPIQSFAGWKRNGDMLFNNITMGIDGGVNAFALIKYMFNGYKINFLKIKPKDKTLYHIASVIASNFLVTQFYLIQKVINKIGLKQINSFDIFEQIILTTLGNIKNKGIKDSLTGPVKRRELQTLKNHKNELKKKLPVIYNYYNLMTGFTKEIK